MPQMKPLNWLIILLMVVLSLMASISFLYFACHSTPHHTLLPPLAKQLWMWKWQMMSLESLILQPE